MVKLGYTWFPKDWTNSESVFELTLSERGLYRELIDLAMLNDNKTIINYKVWSRKFSTTTKELEEILIILERLGLILINNDELFIPSCEPRLNLVRGGRKGGKKSKKNKPIDKPDSKPIDKPDSNQIEKKDKKKDKLNESEIIKELNPEKLPHFFNWLEYRKEIKKPIVNLKTLEALVKKINSFDVDKVEYVINLSIENNYQGLFWDRYQQKNNNTESGIQRYANGTIKGVC